MCELASRLCISSAVNLKTIERGDTLLGYGGKDGVKLGDAS